MLGVGHGCGLVYGAAFECPSCSHARVRTAARLPHEPQLPLGVFRGQSRGRGPFLACAHRGRACAPASPRVSAFIRVWCKTLRIVFRPKYIRLTHTHTHTSAYTRARRCSSSRHCAPRGPRGSVTAPQRGTPSGGRRCPGQPQSERAPCGREPLWAACQPRGRRTGPWWGPVDAALLRQSPQAARARPTPAGERSGPLGSCPRSPVPLFLALRVTCCIFSYP